MTEFAQEGCDPKENSIGHATEFGDFVFDRDDRTRFGEISIKLLRLMAEIPASERSKLLKGTKYVLGVASSEQPSSEGKGHHKEGLDIVWIRDDTFRFSRVVEEEGKPPRIDFSMKSQGLAHDMGEIRSPEQFQESFELSNTDMQIRVARAKAWLRQTEKFLSETLEGLEKPVNS